MLSARRCFSILMDKYIGFDFNYQIKYQKNVKIIVIYFL